MVEVKNEAGTETLITKTYNSTTDNERKIISLSEKDNSDPITPVLYPNLQIVTTLNRDTTGDTSPTVDQFSVTARGEIVAEGWKIKHEDVLDANVVSTSYDVTNATINKNYRF